MFNEFFKLKPQQQINYLKKGPFVQFSEQDKLDFLKKILSCKDASSKTLACTLRLLGNMRHKEHISLQRFLAHPDNAVSSAAKSAMAKGTFVITAPLRGHDARKKEKTDKKFEELLTRINETPRPDEEIMLAFLDDNSIRIRDVVVKELSERKELDEEFLFARMAHAHWNVKSALIEILGNRRSRGLLDRADQLSADPNVEVKLKLISALGKLDRDQVRDHLNKLAKDPHVIIRREARRVLESI